jgi:ABC-type transport system involved in multi-copper enzyme maturation permease subunit
MSAETHVEVYRKFHGKLREHPVRFLPLWGAGLRTALKQRRALFFLYLPPLIGTAIMGFTVYGMFRAKAIVEQLEPGELSLGQALSMGVAQMRAEQMFGVVSVIMWFSKFLGAFTFLIVAWFASGLFCDDRKAGAHQLYFARPLTRLDYALGKLGVAATFAALAMMAPLLITCIVAAVTSPEWSFLKEEWDVILRALAFSSVWTVTVSSLVLLASSLAPRRSFALLGAFAFVVLSTPVAAVLGQFVDRSLYAIALPADLHALAEHIFGRLDVDAAIQSDTAWVISGGAAWTAVCVAVAVSWAVIWLRLRRLEVVA